MGKTEVQVLKQREFAMYRNKQKRWWSQLEGSEGKAVFADVAKATYIGREFGFYLK